MYHDLLDELRIWLHPILVGSGNLRDLFRDGSTARLRLVRTRTFTATLIAYHAAKAKFRPTNMRRCRPPERIDHVH